MVSRFQILVVLLLAWPLLCANAWGAVFTHTPPMGTAIEDVEMPSLAGGMQHLLANATANVIVFFKPGQENSLRALKEIAELEKQFSGKSVHWVGIVSDRIAKPDAEAAVQETGIAMPVLIDAGDKLYGKFDVALEPVTFLCDRDHKLAAYQPFTKVNYGAVIEARIRYQLKEINDEQLAAVLNPPAATFSSDTGAAQRRLKLAEMLFKAKSYDKALESVNVCLEKDPALAAAYTLRGEILVAQDKCSEALPAFDQALKLDPKDARALQGKESCRKK
jgi:tetratricopeptide (TPR) repeat protein